MLNRKIMRELVCLMGTDVVNKSGDMVEIGGNYSFFNPTTDICITITPSPLLGDDISPHIWVKQVRGNECFYFLFNLERKGHIRAQEIGHPHTIYEGLTGAEILAQWPETKSPTIRPYFVTMLEFYDTAHPAAS